MKVVSVMRGRWSIVRFCFALCALLFALCFSVRVLFAQAQQLKQLPRIGYLASGSRSSELSRIEAFSEGLRERGYTEGQNIIIEYRFAEGKLDQLPALAADLVRSKVDVFVTGGGGPTRAAKNATKSIPTILVNISDPVALGFVASLAKPGGNMTGLASIQTDLGGKRVELLKEILPQLSRLAVLVNRDAPGYGAQMKEVEVAAQTIGLQLQVEDIRGPNDLDRAFSAITKGRAGALLGLPNPTFGVLRSRIAELSLKRRLPTMYGDKAFVVSGGLISYGPDVLDSYRRAAGYVDKILKAAKPADLPVEQPKKFELVINLKTAKLIGLTVPPNVLARADKVIK
jgi:putative tryptophan/tyrosine transport system substrate-binding protein